MTHSLYRIFYISLAVFALMCATLDNALAKPKRHAESHRIVLFGGSITGSYGIEFEEDSFEKKLQKQLNDFLEFKRIEVLSASRVGETSVTAMPRVASVLAMEPDIVVIELGQNDALKDFDPDITYNALDQILSVLTHNNVYVMLLGYEAPRSWTTPNQVRFNRMYLDLADRYKVTLYHDVLKGVKGDDLLMQYDMTHPNEDGIGAIVEKIGWELVEMITRR